MPSLNNLVNPPDRTGRGAHPSIWRGIVVNITAHAVWVRVPTLAADDLTATNTIPGDLASGDRVIIGAVEGRVENLVVIAKENPSIPAHTHLHTDIGYPGWATATLEAGWSPGNEAGAFPGLRYRVDSRFIHIHGHITGGPGLITTLPVTPTYTTRLTPTLVLGTDGALTSTETGTVHINGAAPLT